METQPQMSRDDGGNKATATMAPKPPEPERQQNFAKTSIRLLLMKLAIIVAIIYLVRMFFV